jgi:hypothetical protein
MAVEHRGTHARHAGLLATAALLFSSALSSVVPVTGAGATTAEKITYRPLIVTVIGDSVMLDVRPALGQIIPHVQVWATEGRQFSELPAFLRNLIAHGSLGATVIIELGTNGFITQGEIRQAMVYLKGAKRVVFSNVHAPRRWTNPNNALLASLPGEYPNVVVANWNRLASPHPSWFQQGNHNDGIHPPPDGAGAQAYAQLLKTAIN